MKLLSIIIKGYKSIDSLTFTLDKSLKENTYALIGINEAGKSSFLEAISLFDESNKNINKKFFHNKTDKTVSAKIEVILVYENCASVENNIKKKLADQGIDSNLIERIKIEKITIKRVFELNNTGILELENIDFKDCLKDCYFDPSVKKIFLATEDAAKDPNFDLKDCLLKNFDLLNICYMQTHNVLFWKSSKKYLIDESIDLNTFKSKPREISVPLSNCFNLIGTSDKEISEKIDNIISDSVERKNFISQLEEDVTRHIKNVWKEHPVKICFDIDNGFITFLVEDEGTKYDSKTTEQRSDGFRQFISFLLSISAETRTGNLQNYILLIDEPEQHLHPKAAEFLKEELIKVSEKIEDNNIVFYSTHSLFMIDQNVLERNYSVTKKNAKTEVKQVDRSVNTYSSIIYNVFNIYTHDYHNELFGWIQDEKKIFEQKKFNDYLILNNFCVKPEYIESKQGRNQKHKNIALPLYIRNQIHHPENTNNCKFTKDELHQSIDALVKLKENIITGDDRNLTS